MSRVELFELVISRLKRASGLNTDSEIASALGMSQSALANRKQSGSLPYDRLVNFGISNNLNLDVLFGGAGEVDARLLSEVVFSLLHYSESSKVKNIRGGYLLGYYAGLIYNRVLTFTEEVARANAVSSETKYLISILEREGLDAPDKRLPNNSLWKEKTKGQ